MWSAVRCSVWSCWWSLDSLVYVSVSCSSLVSHASLSLIWGERVHGPALPTLLSYRDKSRWMVVMTFCITFKSPVKGWDRCVMVGYSSLKDSALSGVFNIFISVAHVFDWARQFVSTVKATVNIYTSICWLVGFIIAVVGQSQVFSFFLFYRYTNVTLILICKQHG